MCIWWFRGGGNYRDHGSGTGGINYRDHGSNRDRNQPNNTNLWNGDRQNNINKYIILLNFFVMALCYSLITSQYYCIFFSWIFRVLYTYRCSFELNIYGFLQKCCNCVDIDNKRDYKSPTSFKYDTIRERRSR